MSVRIENEPRVVISLSMKEAKALRDLFGSSNSYTLYEAMMDKDYVSEGDIEDLYEVIYEGLINLEME